MKVSEAAASRRSIRAFLDTSVDRAVLERVLETAQRAPSGGNVQPWNAVVLTGEPLARLQAAIGEALALGKAGRSMEYDIYPKGLDGAYEERRVGVGEVMMYEALGIAREDKAGRLGQFAENFRAFGAPVLMLVHTPRYMGPPQWSDIGMWLQTVMLLLRGEGLDSCPQESWAMYGRQVREAISVPEDYVFFCGLAIGRRDPAAPVNLFDVPRAPLSEVVRFEGF
ncbi:nitroreductase [Novosphingobium sp. G106]|uniref:nitroreductase n=1 Tax=Novosphingobium sp. G106 TaxID=2849500 RepID=UPI001C2D9222|nr:nitroreductase [Novosphingobium sp. G106]MBV1688003.1 nitroreductase [Novosphingobium sp. G106]